MQALSHLTYLLHLVRASELALAPASGEVPLWTTVRLGGRGGGSVAWEWWDGLGWGSLVWSCFLGLAMAEPHERCFDKMRCGVSGSVSGA